MRHDTCRDLPASPTSPRKGDSVGADAEAGAGSEEGLGEEALDEESLGEGSLGEGTVEAGEGADVVAGGEGGADGGDLTSVDTASSGVKSEEPQDAPAAGPQAGRAKGRRTKAQVGPVYRQKNGTYALSLGRIFEPATPAPDTRGRAPAQGPAQAPGAADARVVRLVLSSDKRGGHRPAAISHECNGVVIDGRTWRALAVQPRALNARPDAGAVDELLGSGAYDIINVDDGTVVTLYRWDHPAGEPVWALASSNGYDVSSMLWSGSKTYAEVVADLATRIYPGFVEASGMTLVKSGGATRLAFSSLDPARCYTFGFRHHNFHPLRADPERMWQIQSFDVSGAAPVPVAPGLPLIPEQAVFRPPEGAQPTGVTVGSLRDYGAQAIERACAFSAALAKGAGQLPPYLPPDIHYGFILRARDPSRCDGLANVLIESPLLIRIRQIAYDRGGHGGRGQEEPTAPERARFVAMRAFLGPDGGSTFLGLNPDWAPQFRRFDAFVRSVVDLIIHTMRQRAQGISSREPALHSPAGKVAGALLQHICKHEPGLTPFHKEVASLVRDYVANPAYALLFLRALPADKAEAQ